MGVDSPDRVSTRTAAVFLSYASEDAEAAQRICEALRGAGIEVWFDQSELRGGDAWDRQIRKQIHDCVLFVPIISAHSDARREGYFRREWRLAVERAGDIAEDVPFLLPVVIDSTPDTTARVPDRFRDVQWLRLTDGQPSAAFIERVQRLLSPAPDHAPTAHPTTPSVSDATPRARGPSWSKPAQWVTVAVVVLAALAYLTQRGHRFADTFLKQAASPPTPPAAPATAAPTAFNPPPHSIAVLPFVNLSGDKEQEYFSDGLSDELLNSLSRINELQVAARTSSFYFKGEHADLPTIAHKLNVASVLEGSVRRSGRTIRVTAQLNNAVTGYHLWSQTYDRDLGDVLKLQTDIATAVASALKVALLGDVAAKIEVGGTRNPAAFDAYLRASRAYFSPRNAQDVRVAIGGYTEAIRLDPHFALAYADRSLALEYFALNWANTSPVVRTSFDIALSDARAAIALAPDLGDGHLALASAHENLLEFAPASEQYDRALTLASGNVRILRNYGDFAVLMGQSDSGLTALRRAVALDPLNYRSHGSLGRGFLFLRRYPEALAAYKDAQALDPDNPFLNANIGLTYYLLGDAESARSSCLNKAEENAFAQFCLAMTYDKLRRHADAEAILAKMRASRGDSDALRYSGIYAQWANTALALDWLETAMRLRDPRLEFLKMDPIMDPLRKEPRFQAVMRELKFPQ
jgi:TolB-like protein/tetratricopeptide (TPR) repeat protein